MHIITRKRILEAATKHPDCATALHGWHQVMQKNSFENYATLKKTFNSVDKVSHLFVFNVGGNKLRLIAAIHFNTGKVFIRHILTHKEYDSNKWKSLEGLL